MCFQEGEKGVARDVVTFEQSGKLRFKERLVRVKFNNFGKGSSRGYLKFDVEVVAGLKGIFVVNVIKG